MMCSYCGSENVENNDICNFCNAPLNGQRPKMRDFVYVDQVELPFSELSNFHTCDLLILLRLVREERSSCYHLMRSVQKAPENVLIDQENIRFAETEY